MAQETQSQSSSFGCTFDDTGYICHTKRLIIAVGHNTQLRCQSGERIIRYLWFSCANHRKQGGFTRIWETYQTYIRQHLELQNHIGFHTGLTRLCITRCLVGSSTEMPVAQSTFTTTEKDNLLLMFLYLAHKFARVAIVNYSATRHFDDFVLTIFSERARCTAATSVGGKDMFLILEVKQSPKVAVTTQDNMSPSSTISAIRSALWDILCAVEVHTTCTTLTRAAVYLYIINKRG